MPESETAMPHTQPGSKPDPDPTVLTTQALFREIDQLRTAFNSSLTALEKMVNIRLDNSDTEKQHIRESLRHTEEEIDAKVDGLRLLHEEKFSSVKTQFVERDTRTEQTSRDSKVAVDAALQAAKEAVAEQNRSNNAAITKSENTTTKAIEQQGQLITNSTKSLDDKISASTKALDDKIADSGKTTDKQIADIKDRLGSIDGIVLGRSSAQHENKDTQDTGRGNLAIIISVIFGIITLVVNVIVIITRH